MLQKSETFVSLPNITPTNKERLVSRPTFPEFPTFPKPSQNKKSTEALNREKNGKQFTKGKVQLASEILKQLNFYLNPSQQRKRQLKSNTKNSEFKQQPNTVSNVARNILETRKKNLLSKNNRSLQVVPRLKQSKSVKQGTISILRNNEEARSYLSQKNQDFIYTGKAEQSEKSRDRLRLQVVKWFIEQKNDIISAINEYKDRIITWVEQVGYIQRPEFDVIMNAIELKKDRNLTNRLFWLLDLNGDGTIDFNELQYSINLFKEHSLDDKINLFFELCDDNDDGLCDSEDLKRFFHKNLTDDEEIRTMKFVTYDFFLELNDQSQRLFNREDLAKATFNDPNIRTIIEKNTRILKVLNTKDEQTSSSNINNLLFSGQYEEKSGIYFPYIETLMKVMSEKEQIVMYNESLQGDYRQKKYTKINESDEENDQNDQT